MSQPVLLLVTFGSLHSPRHGTAVRGRATVEALAGLGVSLLLVSSEEPVSERHLCAVPGVRQARVLTRPLRYGWSLELVRTCRELAGDAQAVLLGSAMLLPAVMAGAPGLPIIWDANECETLHYGRLPPTPVNLLKGAVWRVAEHVAMRRSASVITVSEEESQHWLRLFPAGAGKLAVVAHRPHVGAGPAAARGFLPGEPGALRDLPPGTARVVFLGAMSAKHNLTAARWLVASLAPRLPAGAVLVLAGEGSDDQGTLGRFGPNVIGLGAVDDADAVISGADVCVAPLISGAGVKTKVLHYLAHGRPVVCTPVAAEGLRGAPGLHVVDLGGVVQAVAEVLARRGDTEGNLPSTQAGWLQQHHGADLVRSQWGRELSRLGLMTSAAR